jgi:hypothetical protein
VSFEDQQRPIRFQHHPTAREGELRTLDSRPNPFLGLTDSSIRKIDKVKAWAVTTHKYFNTPRAWLDSNKDYARNTIIHETNL